MENVDNDFSLKLFVKDSVQFYLNLLEYVKNGCKHYWKYSLLLLIIVGLLFYYKSSKIQTYYSAQSSYTFNYSFKKFYGEIFHYLDQLIINGEYETLAQSLDIPLTSAQSILDLKAKNIENAPLHEDFSDRRVPFYVVIKTTDKELLPSIQKALTNHLINDSLSLGKIKKTHRDLKKQLTLVEQEIKFLDSIKNQFLDTIPREEQKEDVTSVLRRYDDRSKFKIYLESTLRNKDAVTLRIPFQAIEHPKNVSLRKEAIKYGLLYIVLSLFITTSLSWYKQFSDES